MKTASDRILRGQSPYRLPSGIFDVKPKNVTDVQIVHSVGRSRSSDTMRVLSVPPRSFPLFINLRNPGLRTRLAKYGVCEASCWGTILATVRPLSVTCISPCCAAFRMYAPVFACSSRIEIVFMCHSVTQLGALVNGWGIEGCRLGSVEAGAVAMKYRNMIPSFHG